MSGSGIARRKPLLNAPSERNVIRSATIIGSVEEVRTGTILVKPSTLLPQGLVLPLRRAEQWNLIADLTATELGRTLREEGWHFFFIAPPVEASGVGLSLHSAFRKTLARVVRQVEIQGLNATEVASIRVRRFLGLWYVVVTASPRHIRDTPYLRDPDPPHHETRHVKLHPRIEAQNRRRPHVQGN